MANLPIPAIVRSFLASFYRPSPEPDLPSEADPHFGDEHLDENRRTSPQPIRSNNGSQISAPLYRFVSDDQGKFTY